MIRTVLFLFVSFFFVFPGGLSVAATLRVPTPYATITAAVAVANNGDTIEIEAGVYTVGIVATIAKSNITIKGVGGRAHLNGDMVTIGNGKALFVTTGNDITIDNIEFSHVTVPDQNGAGIRHEGGLLTVKNCFFHDNENGILTSNQGSSGQLVVENTEFEHNGLGRSGYTHNIYVGHIGSFAFRYSYSHHATSGHNIKSRAAENHILYSRIMDESGGNASYQIDLPNGGLSYIIGNSLHQGVNAENSRMISYAAEGATNSIQRIYLASNSFVNDNHVGYGVRLSGSPEAVVVNNIFDNLTQAVEGGVTLFANNLLTTASGFVDRATYNYHLTSQSPARDSGTSPGVYSGVSLTPAREYVHPLSSQGRPDDGKLDIGAFEFDGVVPPPGGDHLPIVPANFLLLKE